MSKPAVTFIYALCEPDTEHVRYVGKSNNPVLRLRRHIKNAKDGHQFHCPNWIRSVLRLGLKPTLKVLEECTVENWKEREVFWIEHFRNEGFDLTNCKEGGVGSNPTLETRLKMRLARLGVSPHNKGSKTPDDVRAKLSLAANARVARDPQFYRDRMDRAREAYVQKHKGKPGRRKTTDEIEKIRTSLVGNTRTAGFRFSDEQRKKMSEARKGRIVSEETRQKIAQVKAEKHAQTTGVPSKDQLLNHPDLFNGSPADIAQQWGVKKSYVSHLRMIARKAGLPNAQDVPRYFRGKTKAHERDRFA